MKICRLTSYGATAALLLLTACDESMYTSEGTGTISPLLTYDASVVGSRSGSSRAVTEFDQIKVEDLTLTLTAENGSYSASFPAGDFPVDQEFAIGKYNLTASYGSADEEGFGKPAVFGSTDFTVTEGKTTQVELTAAPSKAMVGVNFDAALTDYMTSVSATLRTAGGNTVDFATDEARFAYVKPGSTSLDVTFTKPNGKGGTVRVADFDALARHRYKMAVALGGDGVGEVNSITITFNDALQQETVDIDISDQILTVPAPEVTLNGVADGEVLTVVEGSALATSPQFVVNARGGIKSAVLTTTGSNLLEQGWPAEVDLANLSEADMQTLSSLGLKNMESFRNGSKMARVDFTAVSRHIPATVETAAPVMFALTVTDANGKTSGAQPLGFGIKVDRLQLTLEAVEGYAYAGDETVDVVVGYNGTDNLRDVLNIEYLNSAGVFKTATIENVTPQGRAMSTYVVSVRVAADAKIPLVIRASAGSTRTSEISIPSASAPELALNAADVFSIRAFGTARAEGYDLSAANWMAEVSTDGKNFHKATAELNGTDLHISGLDPSTAYRARVRVGALVSNEVSFTTEAAAQIPNSNMNSWTESNVDCGAYDITNYTPDAPWATLNALTTSAPNSLDGRSVHTGTVSTDDARSGKAAIVRTVGWKATGAAPYNKQPEERTAGELFLGSYSNGAVYGIDFACRPSALKFWCKFEKFNDGDRGLAVIEVLDASGRVIASGRATPSNATYELVTIDLTYARGEAKAAQLRLKFRSSDKDTVSASDVSTLTTGLLVNHRQHATGASFYIDDVELVY